ncbi:hypothetical protein M23134_05708 [Microscilla marina ATCC 23134]|uniref:Uncharacterized protein n=2 Tax=Microscilla marina TaxID=1027 RepID=A1ZIG7_MICM2|nr:hypothetical protein M23134_05708 [Microscilla marina ATCC 23134]
MSCCCTGGTNEALCKMPHHQTQAQDENVPTPDDDCCTNEITSFKTEVFAPKFKTTTIAFAGTLPVFIISSEEITPVFLEKNLTDFTDSSPPLTGQQQVILYQAFLL